MRTTVPAEGLGDHGVQVYVSGFAVESLTPTIVSFDDQAYDTDDYWSPGGASTVIVIPAGQAGKYLVTAAVTANRTVGPVIEGEMIGVDIDFGTPLPLGRIKAATLLCTADDIVGGSGLTASGIRELAEGAEISCILGYGGAEASIQMNCVLSVQRIA